MARHRTRPWWSRRASVPSRRGGLPALWLAAMAIVAVSRAWPVAGGQRTGGSQSVPQNPRVLLWLPVHVTEPDDHVHAAADCLFRRWAPSLGGLGFDVVVTLAGGEARAGELGARAASLQAIISDSTRHLSVRPRVVSLPVALAADAYDVDEARGRRSSFAGPNELFYGAMGGGAEALGAGPQGADRTTAPPPTLTTALPALIARYAYVQVVETDCCATADGWLDALLQPMLADPGLLISGSRGRGACWTGAEYDGCTRTVDSAIPHAHLRDHINGNAMYRVGAELGKLIASARDSYGSTVPFDVAVHLAGGGKHTADNGRAYSVLGAPVDEARFGDAAYYGLQGKLAFVHAPRRLRAPALHAVLRRLDAGRPVTVVALPPGGVVDPAMLRRLRGSLARTREARNAAYLVAGEDAYAAVARVAPMRVLMMAATGGAGSGQAGHAASLLSSLASLARAGLATFTVGLDATVRQPYTPHLMTLADEQPGTVWVGDGRPEATATTSPPGLLFAPAGERAGRFLEAWAAGEGAGAAAAPTHDLAARHHLALAPLPPDLFPAASSYVGPLWTGEARRAVAAVVAWDGPHASPATPAALSAVGLWRSSTPFCRCANYSVLGRHPLPLASPASIHRSLAARAAFAGFVRDKAIACVALPGFRLATTGNAVPDEAVLGGQKDGLLGRAVVFASAADLEAAAKAGGGGGGGQFVPFEDAAPRPAGRPAAPTGWLPRRAKPARRDPADCAAFGGVAATATSCFSPGVRSLVDAAVAALPPSYQCALDSRRTPADVALLALEGRLGEVGAVVRQRAGGRGRAPILLTGAWRHVAGGQFAAGDGIAPPALITLADLAHPPPARADPMSRLVRFGAPTASLASSPWADVVEYAVCQAARAVHDLAGAALPGPPLTPASTLARRAALIPPAVLADDLGALAAWLDRPDRPSLALAQRAQLATPGSPPAIADDFEDAVLAPSLGLARAVGARLAALPALPVPWSAVVGEPALRRAYAGHAALLPGSVGGLLGQAADVPNNASRGPALHPASIDVLHSPAHRRAVGALERALGAAGGTAARTLAAPPAIYLPAGASPAQHGRLKHFAAGSRSVVLTFVF